MRFSEIDDNDEDTPIRVVMKKLKTDPSQIQQKAFDTEAKFMSHLKHPNVVRLLGVCYHDTAFIMMEYTEGGDLNQFLQSYSEIVTTSSSQTQITSSELVYIASQIASGMQYLASLKFVHRDLATRNCFIGANTIVKVGDLGIDITRYKSHYYPIHGNTLLPIRWMATECFKGTFSEKSDVWAFGVTMWELFTLAKKVPHPSLRDEEVVHNTLKGEDCQFLPKPEACPQPVFQIMERCWTVATKPRVSFDEVHRLIQTCL
jgi:serine/threonine protein kinase